MTSLLKFQIAKAMQFFSFWIPTAVLYYQAQGYTATQIFSLLSFAQLYVVILEYPTGVIGDFFGYKWSVSIGYLMWAIGAFLLSSSLSIPIHLAHVYLFIFAMGTAFTSGSDVALLHSLSSDFKKDSANAAQFAGILQFFGFVIGGLLGAVDLRLPFLFTGISKLIALGILLSIKGGEKEKKLFGTLFGTALKGVKEVFKNKEIIFPILISSVVSMYIISEKWIITPVFQNMGVPVAYFGLGTALIFLFKSQTTGLIKKWGVLNYGILLVGLLVFSLLISIEKIAIIGVVFAYAFGGYISAQSDIQINESVDGTVRASVLSFRNFLARLLNSPYLLMISFVSAKYVFEIQNLFMSVALFILISLSFVLVKILRTKAIET